MRVESWLLPTEPSDFLSNTDHSIYESQMALIIIASRVIYYPTWIILESDRGSFKNYSRIISIN